MKKIIILLFFSSFATFCTAQDEGKNTEISELAKKNAQVYCECPQLSLLISLSKEFQDKKIDLKEYKESGKMAMAQIAECTQHLVKEIQNLTREEFEFFSRESKKYRLEFCAVAIENYNQSTSNANNFD